jgi:hypothetical protein
VTDDAIPPADAAPAPAPVNPNALVAEAAHKSGLLWIDVPGDRAWPAWHEWLDGTAYVVSGPGEQTLPWLPEDVSLILRSKDTGGRLVRVRARAERLTPQDERWEPATAALKASRLNAVREDLIQHWADEATVTALTPYGTPVEGPGSYDDASGVAAPPPSPATTHSWSPWHLRGRPKRRRGTR